MGSPAYGDREAPQDDFSRAGLWGAGLHLQVGGAVGVTMAQGATRPQFHSRVALRYDRSKYAIAVVYRHQRLTSETTTQPNYSENVGHAEFTLTPRVIFQHGLTPSIALEGGLGISMGAFTKYRPVPVPTESSERSFAIPLAPEASGALVWQWRQAWSLEYAVDYRPVVFGNGDIEQLFTTSISLSLDM